MNGNTSKLILEIGATIGASKFARSKWSLRGVPHRWRLKIIQAAAIRGVQLSEDDFEAPAMSSGRAA